MVRTGNKKFSKFGFSIADVAVPLNHLRPKALEAKTDINITPETYSGVAVVTIAKVDKDLSVLLPSRIPANMPISSADGTITAMTQNISMPVKPNLVVTIPQTSLLNRVENPQ